MLLNLSKEQEKRRTISNFLSGDGLNCNVELI